VKKKVKGLSRPKKEVPKPSQDVTAEKASAFDFGGLPERNLKKNLGCG
jgi:hypothetical protein